MHWCLVPLCFLFAVATLRGEESAKDVSAALSSNGKSVILIDPKMRAADYAHAFDFLRKDKPSQKIMVRTENGMLMNVTDVTPSTGGTLLFIKILSNQGIRTEIVPIEQIMELNYSP